MVAHISNWEPIKAAKFGLRSLAYQTDLSFLEFQGRVEDRGEYIVAESIGNPGYFWGNLLVMKRPPRKDDFHVWIKLFQNEFKHQPLVKHITFGWGLSGSV